MIKWINKIFMKKEFRKFSICWAECDYMRCASCGKHTNILENPARGIKRRCVEAEICEDEFCKQEFTQQELVIKDNCKHDKGWYITTAGNICVLCKKKQDNFIGNIFDKKEETKMTEKCGYCKYKGCQLDILWPCGFLQQSVSLTVTPVDKCECKKPDPEKCGHCIYIEIHDNGGDYYKLKYTKHCECKNHEQRCGCVIIDTYIGAHKQFIMHDITCKIHKNKFLKKSDPEKCDYCKQFPQVGTGYFFFVEGNCKCKNGTKEKKKELKLEYGKRYKYRNGKISDPLVKAPWDYSRYSFYDPKYQNTFIANGDNDESIANEPWDLVEEYVDHKLNIKHGKKYRAKNGTIASAFDFYLGLYDDQTFELIYSDGHVCLCDKEGIRYYDSPERNGYNLVSEIK